MICNYLHVLVRRCNPKAVISRSVEYTTHGVGIFKVRALLEDGSKLQVSAIFTKEKIVGTLFTAEEDSHIIGGEDLEEKIPNVDMVMRVLAPSVEWVREKNLDISDLEYNIQWKINSLIEKYTRYRKDDYVIRIVEEDGYHIVFDVWKGRHLLEIRRVSIFEEEIICL